MLRGKRILLTGLVLTLGLLIAGGGLTNLTFRADQAIGKITSQASSIKLTSFSVLSESSDAGPAMEGFNSRVYLAWLGSGNGLLNIMSSNDRENFTSPVTLPETGTGGVALVWFGNRLYIGWTGTDSEHHLNLMSSTDGVNFGDKITLADTSIAAPTLESYRGRLYIAWTGTDDAHHINVMSSTDGVNFGNKVTLDETSLNAPTLAAEFVCGGPADMLFLAWTGTDSRLNSLVSLDGVGFGSKVTVEDSSNFSPGTGALSCGLPLAWTGTDTRLNFERFFGTTSKLILSDTSIAAPALFTDYYDTFYIAWTGTDSGHHLNIARLVVRP